MIFQNLLKGILFSGFILALSFNGPAFANRAAADEDQRKILSDTVAESSLSGSFLAGQVAAQGNDDEAAVAFYQRSVALDPDNADLKRLLFLALAANGRIDDAVEIARKNLADPEEATFTRLVIAIDLLKQKSWSKVGEMLKESADSDLDQLVEQLIVAWATFGAGDIEKAKGLMAEIEGPEWVDAIRDYHSGLMAAANGDDAAAIGFLKSATGDRQIASVLTDTYLRATEALVRSQSRSGDKEGAQKSLNEALDLLPNHPPFKRLEADLKADKQQSPIITSAAQGGSEVLFNVGSALSQQGGAPFAQSFLQLAYHLNPSSEPVIMALAGLFEKQKKQERANSYYETISANSPYHRRAQLEYALNLNELEKTEEAKTVLSSLIKEDPDDLLGYITLGGVLAQHEEYAEAAKVYDAAVERISEPQAQHWNLFYRRGIAYERTKQWDKAEPNFRKSLELSPNQPDVLNYLGYSWIDMGMNLDEGMEMIRKAVELKPNSGFIVDSLGWAHYRLGQYEEAVEELEKAVDLMPEDPVINDHLGDAYWKVGRKLEATFQWNHALASKPTPEEKAKIEAKLKDGLVEKAESTTATGQ